MYFLKVFESLLFGLHCHHFDDNKNDDDDDSRVGWLTGPVVVNVTLLQ